MTEKEVKFCDLSSALHAVGYQSCEINRFQFKSQRFKSFICQSMVVFEVALKICRRLGPI